MAITRLTHPHQLNDLLAQKQFVVVYAHLKNCYPCTAMHPIFDLVAADREKFGEMAFCTVDASSGLEGCHAILTEYKIDSFPHILVFRQTELFCEIPGFVQLKIFEEILSFTLNFDLTSLNARFIASESAGDAGLEHESDTSSSNDNQGIPFIQVHERWRDPFSINQFISHKHEIIVFCSSNAPYVAHLAEYISRCTAPFEHDAVIHIVKLIGPFIDEPQRFFELNLLHYKPFAWMLRGNSILSSYSFRLDETIDFGKWLEGGLEASRIIDSVPEVKESLVTGLSTLKEFRKKTSARYKPVIMLLLDNSAPSIAMDWVFCAVAASPEFKSFSFFRINYEESNDVATELGLHKGPIVAVYRRSAVVAETRAMMPCEGLKDFLRRCLLRSPSPLPQVVPSNQNSETALLSAIFEPLSRSKSVISSHSQGSRLSSSAPGILTRFHSTQSLSRGDPAKCQGNYQPREERSFFKRLLSPSEFFRDPEYSCVVVAEAAREGIQLGRANEGGSYFGVTLRPQTFETDLKLSFAVQFSPDRTERARFVSAYLSFTFGYSDEGGREHCLNVKDIFPKDQKGESSIVNKGSSLEGGMALSLGSGVASITTEGKTSRETHFSRVTAPQVRGSGQYSDTATWTFEEDEGEAGRHGLDSEYVLEATLGGASIVLQDIWIKFWGKAVLILGGGHRPGSKQTLQIGSREQPFRRVLDLSRHVCYSLEGEDGTRSVVSAPGSFQ